MACVLEHGVACACLALFCAAWLSRGVVRVLAVLRLASWAGCEAVLACCVVLVATVHLAFLVG